MLIFVSLASTASAEPLPRVAHAGGHLLGRVYTNSLEALDHSANLGFKLFELDLSFTSDNNLVCLHGWEYGAQRSLGYKIATAPSMAEFEVLTKYSPISTPCTLDSLIEWLNRRKDVRIITDVKDPSRNLEALKLIATKVDNFSQKIIPQAYNPKEINSLKGIGYKDIIFTLYRFSGTDDKVIETVRTNEDLFATTVAESRINQRLIDFFVSEKFPFYIHTLNQAKSFEHLFGYDFFNIYTDYLGPEGFVSTYKQDIKTSGSHFNLDDKKAVIKNICSTTTPRCFDIEFSIHSMNPIQLHATEITERD